MEPKTYTIKGSVWLYPGENAAWHFFTIPKKVTLEIDKVHKSKKRGWGSLRVEAKIGDTIWKTSIFPDRKAGTYMLPIKASVRKAEDIEANDQVTVRLSITL